MLSLSVPPPKDYDVYVRVDSEPVSPKSERKHLHRRLREVFDADDMEMALSRARQTVEFYSCEHPKIAERIEKGMEDTLACFNFPPCHRKKLRTTNPLERLNEGLRRRTRVVRIFPGEASCLRLITALAVEQSEDWETSPRKYLDLDKLEDWVDIEKKLDVPWLKEPGSWPFDEPGGLVPVGEPSRA